MCKAKLSPEMFSMRLNLYIMFKIIICKLSLFILTLLIQTTSGYSAFASDTNANMSKAKPTGAISPISKHTNIHYDQPAEITPFVDNIVQILTDYIYNNLFLEKLDSDQYLKHKNLVQKDHTISHDEIMAYLQEILQNNNKSYSYGDITMISGSTKKLSAHPASVAHSSKSDLTDKDAEGDFTLFDITNDYKFEQYAFTAKPENKEITALGFLSNGSVTVNGRTSTIEYSKNPLEDEGDYTFVYPNKIKNDEEKFANGAITMVAEYKNNLSPKHHFTTYSSRSDLVDQDAGDALDEYISDTTNDTKVAQASTMPEQKNIEITALEFLPNGDVKVNGHLSTLSLYGHSKDHPSSQDATREILNPHARSLEELVVSLKLNYSDTYLFSDVYINELNEIFMPLEDIKVFKNVKEEYLIPAGINIKGTKYINLAKLDKIKYSFDRS